jgi:hypothetical protein
MRSCQMPRNDRKHGGRTQEGMLRTCDDGVAGMQAKTSARSAVAWRGRGRARNRERRAGQAGWPRGPNEARVVAAAFDQDARCSRSSEQ